MVGARFERYSRMESIFCFVDPDSNSQNKWAPYGPIPENGDEPRNMELLLFLNTVFVRW
jgi:hypothetical protein